MLSKPAVTAPILGATKLEHLDAPLAAVNSSLSKREVTMLEARYRPQAVSGLVGPGDLPAGRAFAQPPDRCQPAGLVWNP